jgi:cysteinyl-tRNA synthetase
MDINDGSLTEAAAAWDRIRQFASRTAARVTDATRVPDDFAAAMDDDLGVPSALAVLHDSVRAGNTALDAGDETSVGERANDVAAMTAVLGLDTSIRESGASHGALSVLVERLVTERNAARERKDWPTADRIRDDLDAAGIAVEDGTESTRWTING